MTLPPRNRKFLATGIFVFLLGISPISAPAQMGDLKIVIFECQDSLVEGAPAAFVVCLENNGSQSLQGVQAIKIVSPLLENISLPIGDTRTGQVFVSSAINLPPQTCRLFRIEGTVAPNSYGAFLHRSWFGTQNGRSVVTLGQSEIMLMGSPTGSENAPLACEWDICALNAGTPHPCEPDPDPRIFADGFKTGDTSKWSDVSP